MKFKHFKNFMKDMGEWKNYKKNFYKDLDNEGITPKQFWKRQLKQDNIRNFLGNSFYWGESDECYDYWEYISVKWETYYNENRLIKG